MLYELMTLIGIKNISVKVTGRRKNKVNVVKALIGALQKQTTAHDGVEGTGIYMREVYYRKNVALWPSKRCRHSMKMMKCLCNNTCNSDFFPFH